MPTRTAAESRAVRTWEDWPTMSPEERIRAFRALPVAVRDDLFLGLDPREQAQLILGLPDEERRLWVRLLEPDDAADLVQQAPEEGRAALLACLDERTRAEVAALLAYAEDEAGGLMSPRFARVRPEMTIEEALAYIRRQADEAETIYYAYVLDAEQRLLGVLSFRALFQAPRDARVRDVMRTELVTVAGDADQEEVVRLYREHDLLAIPVVDAAGRMKGIVTYDDIADAVREEHTEDFQKFGGMEALDVPYLAAGFGTMMRKRAGWLAVLFLGEMLTASAMGRFEDDIARAVVLAVFIPLIISSGGNSGSQASTLVIRALAVNEVRLRDWWRVARRELPTGLALGGLLGTLGAVRVVLWQELGLYDFGPHHALLAGTLFFALLGVVTFGALAGSMLPFALRRFGFDPASASAPLVATLVDVTGLVIYFGVASLLLRGTLL